MTNERAAALTAKLNASGSLRELMHAVGIVLRAPTIQQRGKAAKAKKPHKKRRS